MSGGHRLCRLEDIPDGGSAACAIPAAASDDADAESDVAVMAIRRGDRVFCYINSCPHWGSPLDLIPGRFLDRKGRHIVCTTHGARFRIEDGHCIKGPCLGASLRPLACRVENGAVIAELAD